MLITVFGGILMVVGGSVVLFVVIGKRIARLAISFWAFLALPPSTCLLFQFRIMQRERNKVALLPSLTMLRTAAARIFSSSTMKSEMVIYAGHEHTKVPCPLQVGPTLSATITEG